MNHPKRELVAWTAMALLCVGTVELVACRAYAPELYQQITAPVIRCLDAAYEFGRDTVQTASSGIESAWAKLTAPKPKPVPVELPPADSASIPEIQVPVADPPVTELNELDGRQVLTGGLVQTVYFNQSDEVWADQPYGNDDIGTYGCGPTAMAMAVSSLTEEYIDPAEMAAWAVDHGFWAPGEGSYRSIINGTAKAFGLTAQSLPQRTPDAIRQALLSGKLVVALMGPGHFTDEGHFILIRAATLSGEVLVADPNSTEHSLMSWDPQLILDELSSSTSNGGPIWTLSPPAQ